MPPLENRGARRECVGFRWRRSLRWNGLHPALSRPARLLHNATLPFPPPRRFAHRCPPVHVVSHSDRPARARERIAVVVRSTALIAQIGPLTAEFSSQTFDDLFASAAEIADHGPRALILEPSADFAQDLGGIRVLRSLLPELAVLAVSVGPPSPSLLQGCDTHGVTLVDAEHGTAELSRALETLLHGGIPSDSYLQFAQGICDEINNPLMFASGHLQVLDARLPAGDPARGQVVAIRDGLDRIRRTMEKIVPLGRATPHRCIRSPRTFGALLDALDARLIAAGHSLATAVGGEDSIRALPLADDADLVDPALFGLCEVAAELQTDAEDAVLHARADGDVPELLLVIRDPRLASWELPSAFEPYSINQIMRGTSCGLNLFVLRLVCRAHGWDAQVSRQPDRQVAFCVRLGPAASPI